MAKFLAGGVAVLIVALSGYSLWYIAVAFGDAISAARPEVSAAVIGAMATVFVGLSAVLLSQAHDRRRVADEAHRLKKVEIYQGFISIVARMMGSSNEHLNLIEPDTKELVQYLFKFKSDILLWGSPKVIKAQIEFESVAHLNDSKKTFRAVDQIYQAIRADLGLSNYGLNKLELAKLYLTPEARKEFE